MKLQSVPSSLTCDDVTESPGGIAVVEFHVHGKVLELLDDNKFRVDMQHFCTANSCIACTSVDRAEEGRTEAIIATNLDECQVGKWGITNRDRPTAAATNYVLASNMLPALRDATDKACGDIETHLPDLHTRGADTLVQLWHLHKYHMSNEPTPKQMSLFNFYTYEICKKYCPELYPVFHKALMELIQEMKVSVHRNPGDITIGVDSQVFHHCDISDVDDAQFNDSAIPHIDGVDESKEMLHILMQSHTQGALLRKWAYIK
jgi:hypothetical protein